MRSIYRELSVSLTVVIAVVGMLMSFAAYYLIRSHEVSELRNTLQDEIEHFSITASKYLWTFDEEALREVIQSHIDHGSFSFIGIYDDKGALRFSGGKLGNTRSLEGSTPLRYENRDLGKLVIQVNRDYYARGNRQILISLLSLVFAIALTTFLTVRILLNKLLYVPLMQISDNIASVQGDSYAETNIQTLRSDFEVITSSFNAFIQKLISRDREVQEKTQALKESKESFQALVEFTEAIHWEFDLVRGVFTYVSPQIRDILGIEPEAWHTLDDWAATLHPEDRQRAVEYCLMQTAQTSDHAFMYRVAGKGGSTVWLHDIVKVITDSDGNAKKLIGIMLDITETKEHETQIRHSLLEKEVLLREVHHRVKNNMQVISSLLNMQAALIKDNDLLELFRESQNRIQSMALVHEMLYQNEQLSHVSAAEYIAALVRRLTRSYKGVMQLSHDIVLDNIFLGPDILIPCGLILNELISNSLKYAFSTGQQRENILRIRLHQARESKLYLMVEDNGPGLPRGNDLAAYSGLGLRLVATLVKQLEGSIVISSEEGAKFEITFPERIRFAGRN